jgi:hypothetical protein
VLTFSDRREVTFEERTRDATGSVTGTVREMFVVEPVTA